MDNPRKDQFSEEENQTPDDFNRPSGNDVPPPEPQQVPLPEPPDEDEEPGDPDEVPPPET